MNNTILVLGSNSPSGAAFCKQAALRGDKVIATSRSPELADVFLPYKFTSELDIEFHRLDINHNLDLFSRLVTQHKVNCVVNFASQSMVGQSWTAPENWMQTNVVGLVSLLERMRGIDRLDKYIHFSTPEVYGSTSEWQSESNYYSPSTPYASSRAAGDLNVKLWADTYGMPNVITRAANIYGAGQQLYRIIPKTFMCCLMGVKLPLHGGGLSERAFIHIDDVAHALIEIIKSGNDNDSYHISPHKKISIRSIVSLICEMSGQSFNNVVEEAEDRVGKDQAYLLNSDKIMQQLNWEPKVPLLEGLEDVYRWCQENREFLSQQPMNYVHKL